jgi:hypothetical protein
MSLPLLYPVFLFQGLWRRHCKFRCWYQEVVTVACLEFATIDWPEVWKKPDNEKFMSSAVFKHGALKIIPAPKKKVQFCSFPTRDSVFQRYAQGLEINLSFRLSLRSSTTSSPENVLVNYINDSVLSCNSYKGCFPKRNKINNFERNKLGINSEVSIIIL